MFWILWVMIIVFSIWCMFSGVLLLVRCFCERWLVMVRMLLRLFEGWFYLVVS